MKRFYYLVTFRPSVLQIENYALILGGNEASTGNQVSVVQSYDMSTPQVDPKHINNMQGKYIPQKSLIDSD